MKHGHCRNYALTRTYRIWMGMRARCANPRYLNYAARGIKCCERWARFESFLEDMGEAPPGLSIDRINNDGNYEPGNCRWATRSQQASNMRPKRTLTFRGECRSLAYWAKTTGLDRRTIHRRLLRGWTVEDALTTPPLQPGRPVIGKLTEQQVREIRQLSDRPIAEIAKRYGVDPSTIRQIIRREIWRQI